MVAASVFQEAWFAMSRWLVHNESAVMTGNSVLAAMAHHLDSAQATYKKAHPPKENKPQ